MKYSFVLFVLCMSLTTHAQDKKNELQLGVPGAYFFDETPYRVHSFTYIPFATQLRYKRVLNDKWGVSLGYSFFFLYYRQPNRPYELYEIHLRELNIVQAGIIFKGLLSDKSRIDFFLEANYRLFSGELFVARNGGVLNTITDWQSYNDFGISLRTQARLIEIKNFNLGAGIGYTRYFTKTSPNQLSTSFFIGYEF